MPRQRDMEDLHQNNIETLRRLRFQLRDIIAAEESAFRATVEDYNRRISVLYAELQAVAFQENQAMQAAAAAAQIQYANAQAHLSHQAASFTPGIASAAAPPQPPPANPPTIDTASPIEEDTTNVAPEEPPAQPVSSPISHLPMLFPVPQQPAQGPAMEPAARAEEGITVPASLESGPATPATMFEPQPGEEHSPGQSLDKESISEPQPAPQNGDSRGDPNSNSIKAGKLGSKRASRKNRGRSTTGFEDILEGRYGGKSDSRRSSRNGSPLPGSNGRGPANGTTATSPPEINKEEEFPSLGSALPASTAVAPAPAAAVTPRNNNAPVWSGQGASALASKLAQQPTWPAMPAASSRLGNGAAVSGVEDAEIAGGLRVAGDYTPDSECRRRVRRRTFELQDFDPQKRREVNLAEGLEVHLSVLSPEEQAGVVTEVESWVKAGKAGEMRGRTFSAPKKWMPGKGRITIQFGCCYNYAVDSDGRDPGIIPEEVVEPMPPLLRVLSKRLVRWGLLPGSKEPNSAIVNIYEEGDCIPPHIDNFDFVRPFCSLSLVSEQPIMFARKLLPAGPGQFEAQNGVALKIPLPPGSCLVLTGKGGDTAMHCIPPVTSRRISITLRRIGPKHAPLVAKEVAKVVAAEGGKLKGFWEQ